MASSPNAGSVNPAAMMKPRRNRFMLPPHR
jgi:hypothetical protein